MGNPGSFTVTAIGVPPVTTLVRTGALPAGVTFTDNGNGAGTLSGTPAAGTGGTYLLTFTASNGIAPATQTFTLTVQEPPTITSASATAFAVGQAGTFMVTTTGFPTPVITQGGVTLPSGVAFVDNGNGMGTLSGIPAAGTQGTYALTFTASNGVSPSAVQTFTLTVSAAGTPLATSQSATTAADTPRVITLGGSDADSAGLTFSIGTGPSHGSLSALGAPVCGPAGSGSTCTADVTYTPTAGYTGPDSFTFTVSDGSLTSAPAIVSLTVTAGNAAPVAASQSATTAADTPKLITLGGSDADSVSLTFSVGTGPTHGSLSALGAPVCGPAGTGSACTADVTYTPTAGYTGPDSFTFTVSDGSLTSAPATVSLTVTAPNAAPVAASQGGVTTAEDTPAAITLSATDSDNTSVSFTIVSPPAHGTLSALVPNPCTPDGLGGATCTAAVTYTPAANFNGNDSFTFKANDGTLDSNVATVSVAVNAVNDTPVANSQTAMTPEDTATPITLSGIDVDGGPLSFAIASGPSHGTLGALGAPSCTTDVNGVSTCTAAVTYTPTGNFNGSDSFTFTVSNGSLTSNAGTVTIDVTAANDAPVALDQTLTSLEDTAKTVTLSATDADGNSLTFSIVASPLHGSLSAIAPVACTTDVNGISTCTADVMYTPTTGFTGPDSFTFKANDGGLDSNVATVSITVTSADTAPTITSANATTFTVGQAGSFTVTTTGTPTVTTITRGGVGLPGGVNYTDNGNGTATLSGTPSTGTSGTYVFTFTATNGIPPDAVQNPFTLTINQPPAITSANTTTFAPGKAGQTFTVTTTGFPTNAISRTGTLPSGVTFTDNGNNTATIAGTPAAGTQSGSPYAWVITAANGALPDAVQNFSFNVVCPALTVSGTIPALTFNTAMATATFTQTGGNGAIAWSAAGLPTGTAINPVTGQVTGTPTVTGTFNVTITTTDAGGCTGLTSQSVTVAPVATGDSYSGLVDNTQFVITGGTTASPATPFVGTAGRITANDLPSGFVTATAGTFATSGGGSVTIAADGTFIYTPKANPGAAAITSDSFTYTVFSNTGGGAAVASAPGTVSLTLAGRVWYVLNNGAAGNGQSQSTFNTLAAAVAASTANDTIFVYQGTGTTTNLATASVLKTGQSLIGQGVALVVNSQTLVAAGGFPLLGNTVTLATNVTVNGLDMTTGAANGIVGTSVTGLSVTVRNLTTTTGTGVNLSNTAGTLNFTGLTTTGGAGANLVNNTGATFTFSNVTVSSGANPAFTATGGGTISVTGSTNTLTTTTGTALNVANTTIGASGLTFQSISSTGATNGIVLNTTGAGALTVTGTGTTGGSGGTIQAADQGALFTSANNITLKNMNFTNAGTGNGTCNNIDGPTFNSSCKGAINLNGVTTVTLDNLNMNGGVQNGINGQTVSGLTLSNTTITGFGNAVNENAVRLFNLTGTCAITNSSFSFPAAAGAYGDNLIDIRNNAGTLTLSVQGTPLGTSFNTFSDTQSSTNGAAGLSVTAVSSATVNLTVKSSKFLKMKTVGIQTFARDTSTMNVDVVGGGVNANGNTFDPQGGLGRGVDLNAEDTAHLNFNISNNPKIYGNGGPTINVFGINNAVIQGRINNNPDIRGGGVGAAGSPIFLHPEDNSTGTIEVLNNVIAGVGNDPGIFAISHGDGASALSATLDVTLQNNHITIAGTGVAGSGTVGIDTRAGANNGDTIKTCVDVQSNAITLGPSGSDIAWLLREGSSTSNLYVEGWNTNANTTWNGRANTPANSTFVFNAGGAPAIGPPPAGAPYNGACRSPANPTQ